MMGVRLSNWLSSSTDHPANSQPDCQTAFHLYFPPVDLACLPEPLGRWHSSPEMSSLFTATLSHTSDTASPFVGHLAIQSYLLSIYLLCMHACSVTQSCTNLCNPMDCSLPGSSVLGILQARILEWVNIPFSRGSS